MRTLSRFESLEDIERVTVGVVQDQPIHLGEVARVFRTHKERTEITHIDGVESVELSIFKEGDANIVEMARRVTGQLDGLRQRLPDGVRLEVLFDQSLFIASAVRECAQQPPWWAACWPCWCSSSSCGITAAR